MLRLLRVQAGPPAAGRRTHLAVARDGSAQERQQPRSAPLRQRPAAAAGGAARERHAPGGPDRVPCEGGHLLGALPVALDAAALHLLQRPAQRLERSGHLLRRGRERRACERGGHGVRGQWHNAARLARQVCAASAGCGAIKRARPRVAPAGPAASCAQWSSSSSGVSTPSGSSLVSD